MILKNVNQNAYYKICSCLRLVRCYFKDCSTNSCDICVPITPQNRQFVTSDFLQSKKYISCIKKQTKLKEIFTEDVYQLSTRKKVEKKKEEEETKTKP